MTSSTKPFSDRSNKPTDFDKYRSEFVPQLGDEEREAFKKSLLDELEVMHKLGHLRPARGR